MSTNPDHINQLAAIIREVQGTRRMGAAALAEAILSHPGSLWQPPAALAQPEVREVGDLIRCLQIRAVSLGAEGANLLQRGDAFYFDRAATLLQQLSAPAPVVVPVAKSERLPDSRPESEGGDCDAEGRCWVFTPRSATPNPNWTLLWIGHMQPYHSHWRPASAIPAPSNYIRDQKFIRPDSCSLPQAGEVMAPDDVPPVEQKITGNGSGASLPPFSNQPRVWEPREAGPQ